MVTRALPTAGPQTPDLLSDPCETDRICLQRFSLQLPPFPADQVAGTGGAVF